MRLVDQEPEQHAGQQRSAVEHRQRGADEGGGQQAVMAVAQVDEDGREGEREEEPQGASRLIGGAYRHRHGRACPGHPRFVATP